MSNVKRIYVEKKKPYDIRAKELKGEIQSYRGMNTIEKANHPLLFSPSYPLFLFLYKLCF